MTSVLFIKAILLCVFTNVPIVSLYYMYQVHETMTLTLIAKLRPNHKIM